MLKISKNDNFSNFFSIRPKVCESKVVCGKANNLTRNRSTEDAENIENDKIKNAVEIFSQPHSTFLSITIRI